MLMCVGAWVWQVLRLLCTQPNAPARTHPMHPQARIYMASCASCTMDQLGAHPGTQASESIAPETAENEVAVCWVLLCGAACGGAQLLGAELMGRLQMGIEQV